jgi:hypothetical protein
MIIFCGGFMIDAGKTMQAEGSGEIEAGLWLLEILEPEHEDQYLRGPKGLRTQWR